MGAPDSSITAADAPELFLDWCPTCAYALEGLPIEHRCPECGLHFDRRWRVFGGSKPGQHDAEFRRWMIFVPLMSFNFGMMAAVGGQGLLNFLVRFLIALGVFSLIVWVRRLLRVGRWLAITQEGVRVYRGKQIVNQIRWDEFDHVWHVFTGELEFRGPKGVRKIDPRRINFSDPGDISRAVNAINTYPYRPDPR